MYQLVFKRLIDVALATVAILPALTVGLMIAVAIRRSGPGPVLMSVNCRGRNGTTFRQYRFRTTWVDMRLRRAAGASDAECITPVGHFLISSGLHELPQLLHILLGQMSFIGPRAQACAAAEGKPDLPVRPGLLAPQGISAKQYADKLSLLGDLRILFASLS